MNTGHDDEHQSSMKVSWAGSVDDATSHEKCSSCCSDEDSFSKFIMEREIASISSSSGLSSSFRSSSQDGEQQQRLRDVDFPTGKGMQEHEGNKRMKHLVTEFALLYFLADKGSNRPFMGKTLPKKHEIVEQIIRGLTGPGGKIKKIVGPDAWAEDTNYDPIRRRLVNSLNKHIKENEYSHDDIIDDHIFQKYIERLLDNDRSQITVQQLLPESVNETKPPKTMPSASKARLSLDQYFQRHGKPRCGTSARAAAASATKLPVAMARHPFEGRRDNSCEGIPTSKLKSSVSGRSSSNEASTSMSISTASESTSSTTGHETLPMSLQDDIRYFKWLLVQIESERNISKRTEYLKALLSLAVEKHQVFQMSKHQVLEVFAELFNALSLCVGGSLLMQQDGRSISKKGCFHWAISGLQEIAASPAVNCSGGRNDSVVVEVHLDALLLFARGYWADNRAREVMRDIAKRWNGACNKWLDGCFQLQARA